MNNKKPDQLALIGSGIEILTALAAFFRDASVSGVPSRPQADIKSAREH
jgi:hypothetical protein